MKIRTTTQPTFLCAALLLRAFFGAATAQVGIRPAVMLGEWSGFYQGIGDPNELPADLFVRSQQDGDFTGRFVLGPEPDIFPVNGKIFGNQVRFHGRSPDGRVMTYLALHAFAYGAAILDGDLEFQPPPEPDAPPNPIQEGSLIQLRRFVGNPDGSAPPDVTGNYVGFAVSDATGERIPMSARLVAERSPSRAPTTGFGLSNVSIEPCVFPVGLGTINSRGRAITHAGVSARAFDVVMIAQGDGENLRLIGEYHRHARGSIEPCIRGEYLMKHTDGTEDHGTFEIDFSAPPEGD